MTFDNFEDMVKIVKSRGIRKRYAVVAAESERTLESVLSAYNDGFLEPLLIGDPSLIIERLEELGGKPSELTILPADTPEAGAQKAVDLVNEGKADCIMRGNMETSKLMSVVLRRSNKMRTGGIVSGVTILNIPTYHKLIAYTDGGITLFPNLEEKKLLIENGVGLLRRLGVDCPKVAVLAAIETVTAKIPATVEARALRDMNEKGEIRDCIVEGPISYDLAVNKEAAIAKGFNSPVAGDTDLLLWPDVNAGNIAGKALIHSAKARLAAVVLGAKVPVLISSRSSSFDEKYLSMALAALW